MWNLMILWLGKGLVSIKAMEESRKGKMDTYDRQKNFKLPQLHANNESQLIHGIIHKL